MKKHLSFLLCLGLIMTLVACSGPDRAEQPTKADNKYEKYDTLIGHIEAGNYTDALVELDRLLPTDPAPSATAQPSTETVEITMDNWQEYFDLVLDTEITRNAFDEIKYVYSIWEIGIKEEYQSKLYLADVSLGYHASAYGSCTFTYDLDSGLTSYGNFEAKSKDLEDAIRFYYDTEGTVWGEYGFSRGFFGSYTCYTDFTVEGNTITWQQDEYTKLDITRVQGTLEFYTD